MDFSFRLSGSMTGLFALLLLMGPSVGSSQQPGSITGTVSQPDGRPLPGVMVAVDAYGLSRVTGPEGGFVLEGVPGGEVDVRFSALGFEGQTQVLTVAPGAVVRVDVVLQYQVIKLSDMIVRTASRVPERVVEAPASVAVVDRGLMSDLSITQQVPHAMRSSPGVDVIQSGVNDFNVNMRGFNTSLNRRVLVLQDGRDLALALLGPQEWGSLTNPLGDYSSVEIVKGPGSALYGANAYSGVVDIRTFAAREVEGTKASIGGGELGTFRADARHALVAAGGRVGLKVNLGYSRSDSWTLSRTTFDGGDLAREYSGATDHPVNDEVEAIPLFGQTVDPVSGSAMGEPDPIQAVYGSARMDYYAADGSVALVEGGVSRYENTVYVTDSGRIQMDGTLRPWMRLAWDRAQVNLAAWYTGRNTGDTPQRSLLSGAEIVDKSGVLQIEGQANREFAGGGGRIVVGASARNTKADTELTLFSPEDDDRSDKLYAVFGQVEYHLSDRLKVVAAARYDRGTLFSGRFSPRSAIVFSPTPNHSLRVTYNQAFLTPTQIEKYLRLPAAPPSDFSALEAGMRQAFGEALSGVAQGTLFTTSSAVPILTLGNEDLGVEEASSFEIGYKGQIGDRVFVTADLYYSQLTNSVTDLMPGANPNYEPWTPPEAVPAEVRGPLQAAVLQALGPGMASAGLTRLADGSTAIALSFGNAGDADVYGVEAGAAFEATPEVRIDANYTYFGFEVDASSLLPGTAVEANSPKHQGNVSLTYQGAGGLSLGASFGVSTGYDWAAGVFSGRVPGRETLDLRWGYRLTDRLRIHGVATNAFDQQRFHLYGGSVVGRRVLMGLTVVQ